MNKYNDSKIYKIVDNTSDMVYIGSTIHKYLSQRLQKHVYHYKDYLKGSGRRITSFSILENNDYDIILIENLNCETIDQLKARERFHIENTPNCVNRNIPTRTAQEYYQQKYIENKETILEERKQYYEDNKERVLQRVKTYRDNNNECYLKNKDKYKQPYECECGSTICYGQKARHFRSKTHLNLISNK